jgi:hypothetical protein
MLRPQGDAIKQLLVMRFLTAYGSGDPYYDLCLYYISTLK